MAYTEGTCGMCGIPYGRSHPNRRYCSDLCKHRAHGARVKVKRSDQVRAERAQPAPSVEAADLAWLAGLLDGEGTVALTHGSTGTPHLRLALYNNCERIMGKIRAVLTATGVTFYEKWDRRGGRRPNCMLSIGTDGSLALYPLLRPHLVRQVERYDAAVAFLRPRYEDRHRVQWTPDDRAAWNALRAQFNRTHR